MDPSTAFLQRNLLFGILAARRGLVTQEALVSAFGAAAQDPTKPLGHILLEGQALDEPAHALVESLVDDHLRPLGFDTARGLVLVDAQEVLGRVLPGVEDPRWRSTLERAASLDAANPDSEFGATGPEGGREAEAATTGGVDPFATIPPMMEARAAASLQGPADPYATAVPAAGDGPFASTINLPGGPTQRDGGPSATPAPGGGPRRYRIIRAHAKGGLGAVFLAQDLELQREVALKEIQDRHAYDPALRARFLLEAEVTGSLEHPGIVPIYGLGQDIDGRPYYAMRFIEGESLGAAIKQFHQAEAPSRDPGERALALRRLLTQFVDVCEAVAYAHSRGVIHRDLKPDNVMLGAYGETLVVDWGLAKPLGRCFLHAAQPADSAVRTGTETEFDTIPEPSRSAATAPVPAATKPASQARPFIPSARSVNSETLAGSALGTPQFMSPEQAAGDLERIGPASDIYSLGASLHALLTGKPPFTDRDLPTVLDKVRRGEFPPPRKVNPTIPGALEAIVMKAMALQPDRRYASAKALGEDIEHWLADEPVSAWKEPLAKRVRRWARKHRTLVIASSAAALVAVASCGYIAHEARLRAERDATRRLTAAIGRVDALKSAEVREIPNILEQLGEDRALVRDDLEKMARRDAPGASERQALPAALALLPDDPEQAAYLVDRLLQPKATPDDPDEVLVIREALSAHAQRAPIAARLWTGLAGRPTVLTVAQMRAAGALARLTPDDPRWPGASAAIARTLVHEYPLLIGTWRRVFQPIAPGLLEPLRAIYADRSAAEPRALAFTLLLEFATQAGHPRAAEDLAALVGDADPDQFRQILVRLERPEERDRAIVLLAPRVEEPARFDDILARRQGRWAMALLRLGQAERVWPLFRFRDDPGLRTELIHNLRRFGFEPAPVLARLRDETDVSAQRALILCLGEFPLETIDVADRRALAARLVPLYREAADPGLHSAIGWLLRGPWGRAADLDAIDAELASPALPRGRDWFVNGQGQTFAILRGPREFLMGSTAETDPERVEDEVQHLRRIGRSFAIATREITVADYIRFLEANPALVRRWDETAKAATHPVVDWRTHPLFRKNYYPTDDCPIGSVTWYEAARYCNWLSDREGLPEAQRCYPDTIGPGMTLPPDHLDRVGYRLPTEAEWECACRAGTRSARPQGHATEWIDAYEWFGKAAAGTTHPVGRKQPNDLGLFDMLGNLLEWCADTKANYPAPPADAAPIDDTRVVPSWTDRYRIVLRGASVNDSGWTPRSAFRLEGLPSDNSGVFGFRPVRTVVLEP